MSDETPTSSQDIYPDTPEGQAKLWKVELDAARTWLADFHEDGEKIEKRYRDERTGDTKALRRLNIYPANVQTQEAMMFGKVPTVDVSRTFDDAEDPVARLTGIILKRVLNNDVKRPIDTYVRSLGRALKDRRLSGLGQCRVEYRPTFKKVPSQPAKVGPDGQEQAAAVPEHDSVDLEECEIRYCSWRNQLWSPCERQEDMRWWAEEVPMDRKQLRERFNTPVSGQEGNKEKLVLGDLVPLNAKKDKEGNPQSEDPWARANVWEIHSKEKGCVYWYVDGFDRILDQKENPLGLDGFWPFGDPMSANLHNRTTIPKPDFHLCKDTYNNIDLFTTRIHRLAKAVKVAAAADASIAMKLKQLIDSEEGDVIDVENWALHAQKGGLKGRIDWFPIDMIVAAIDKLREMRTEEIGLAYQISGMSDLTRGQQVENGTPGEAQLKAKFANVRTQGLQEEFAKFATELQRLKAEVIAKHFKPETIIQKSNILNTPDGKDINQVNAAVAFLKSNYWQYRVEVKADSLASDDYQAKQAEASEAITAMANFLSMATPLAQTMPNAVPLLLELLQAAMTNYRWFASKAESIFARAVAQANQAAQQAAQNPQAPPPDPKLQAAQLKLVSDGNKAQADMQKERFKFGADMQRMQMETEQKNLQEQNQAAANIAETKAKHAIVQAGKPFGTGGGT